MTTNPTPPPDRVVNLGYVQRAHGIKGWVRCRCDGHSLVDLKQILLNGREYKITHATAEHDSVLVKLEGVDDRNTSETLIGKTLTAPRDWLPPPDEGEIYVGDLVGCTLLDTDGKTLGIVRAIEQSVQELLDVESPTGLRFLVPFVEPLITAVDLTAKTIVCDLPEGLIELQQS